MNVTLKDIAKQAGVRMSTVSFVLNDNFCREATTTKNMRKELANKHKYQMHQTAYHLVFYKKRNVREDMN